MKQVLFVPSLLGELGIAEENGSITNLFFGGTVAPDPYERGDTPLLREAARQLEDYFGGTRTRFDLPLAPAGTDFQRKVWSALQSIPCGETRTYGQLAAQIGQPRACRAVGRANGLNPISILIPCHRVVGAGGGLTGYAGGLAAKERLLKLEGVL